ncbi:MAG: TRAP transporter large permease subunit, partial [Alphaproteobacteria bacterium]
MVFWTLFGGLVASVLSGAVLGAALGLTGFAILWFHAEGALQIGVQAVWNMLTTYTLTAVPLFILLGDVLVASGLAAGVYRALAPVFARVPGGLLHPHIAVCPNLG